MARKGKGPKKGVTMEDFLKNSRSRRLYRRVKEMRKSRVGRMLDKAKQKREKEPLKED